MTGQAFDAWFLPDIVPDATADIEVGELTCRYPVPGPELVGRAVAGLRAAGETLRDRPVDELVAVVDAAAARLADPGDPLRSEAETLVAAATGYSGAMTRLVLHRMTADWRADRLRSLLAAELPDPGVLDGFRPVGPARRTRASGPRLAFHVFAGNVPGVAVTSLVRALLVKAPSLGKLASGQPVLPVLFARAVASVDPAAGRALAVTYWPGGATEVEAQAVDAADTVVVYGGEEVVEAYRDRIDGTRRLVVHGPRFSAGLITRDAAAADRVALARSVARAVAVFDQQGCVSPHAVWVEDAADFGATELAELLAGALEELEQELPRGRVSPGEAAAIHQERAAAELEGYAGTEGTGPRVLAGDGTRWTVIHDPDPSFRPSCLNRVVRVHPVATIDEALDALVPVGGLLQSVAVACGDDPDRREELARRLARVGATRVTTFERLPWPPPAWHHDGGEPLRELLHWVDLED